MPPARSGQMSQSAETERRTQWVSGWRQVEWGVNTNGRGVSFWGGDSVLEQDTGDGHSTL